MSLVHSVVKVHDLWTDFTGSLTVPGSLKSSNSKNKVRVCASLLIFNKSVIHMAGDTPVAIEHCLSPGISYQVILRFCHKIRCQIKNSDKNSYF